MKKITTILLTMAFMLVTLVSTASARENEAGKDPIIIDVRTEAEWTAGHLEGAVLIPYERIGEEIAKTTTDKTSKIYLYCRTGRRTGIAVETLKRTGYENLVNLETVDNAAKVLHRSIVK
jgi:phage shock protein E